MGARSDPFGRTETGGDPFGGAEAGSNPFGGGETAAASAPAATPPTAAAERSRWIPQLALWQWARGEGGGARILPGGVQHLWQEVNTQKKTKRKFEQTIKYKTQYSTASRC